MIAHFAGIVNRDLTHARVYAIISAATHNDKLLEEAA
jgi:hypothetical protein